MGVVLWCNLDLAGLEVLQVWCNIVWFWTCVCFVGGLRFVMFGWTWGFGFRLLLLGVLGFLRFGWCTHLSGLPFVLRC